MKSQDKNQDFDIMYNEYVQQFVDIINNSGMPLTITCNVLKDLLNQVSFSVQEKLEKYQKEQQTQGKSQKEEN